MTCFITENCFCDQRASWEYPNLRYGRFSLNCENSTKNCVQHLFPLECVFNTFAGSFYSYMELVTIYGVLHGKFCLRSSCNRADRAVSCILCILCSVLWLLKRKSRLLNFQVTDSFLNFKHLQYIYICSCTKLFAYHCLASVVLKTCIAQFDLIVNCALTSCAKIVRKTSANVPKKTSKKTK
jgi:uncharacterized membrane protein